MKILIPCVLFLLLTSSAIGQEKTLVINTGFTPPVSTVFKLVLEEAFNRLNMRLIFQEMPAERSINLVSSGIDDGDCCRIPSAIQEDYPDLLSVPVSFFSATFSAFSKEKTMSFSTWQDLKPYNIGVVPGWKILVTNVKKVNPRGYTVIDTPEAMFRMLDMGRIDVATYGYLSGLKVLSDQHLKDIYALDPPLAVKPLFLQLNKKHSQLVPEIARVFQEMKDDGTIDRITGKVVKELK